MISDSDWQKRRILRGVWTAVALAALIAVTVAVTWIAKPMGSAIAATAPPEVAALDSVQAGLVWIANRVEPSVVFIEAEQKAGGEEQAGGGQDQDQDQGQDQGQGELPEPWRKFFGPGSPFQTPPRPQPQTPSIGQGSGVIIDSTGYILTNNHVVGGAAKVTVHLGNGESYSARVIGTDKLTDLAVIKIEPKQPLTAAKLGDADTVKPGMWAIAIGYPFGATGMSGYGGAQGRFDEPERYEPTLTLGVVSATNRQIQSDIPGRPFRDLIQTDAPINPGNSGGPLVNIRAEVVGINQAIFTASPFGGNIGVGFAIPIDAHTKEVIKTIKGGAPVVRGQLGVQVKALTPALKDVYGAKSGVFVDRIQPDTAAAKAGMQAEDIITKYNGKEVDSTDQFVTMVQGTKPGTTADIVVLRAGKPTTIKVTVGAYAPEVAEKKPPTVERMKLGISVEPVPEEMARDLDISGGARIRDVNPLGDGARAGLKRGDVIVKVNRGDIGSVEDYKRVTSQLKKGAAVVIRAWTRRTGSITTFEIDSLSE
jgi:serine protease Do